MIRIFVIDDHFMIADGLDSHLQRFQIKVVGQSCDVESSLEFIDSLPVDIIILDLILKEKDPVINIKMLRETFPDIPVVVLSQEEGLAWKIKMFQMGAFAFIHKYENAENMANVLRLVKQGHKVMPAEVELLLNTEDKKLVTEKVSGSKEIIQMLKEGYDIKEIASIMGQSQSSIDKKLNKIRKLYNLRTNCQLVYYFFLTKMPFRT